MLALSRKQDEAIVLDNGVRIEVIKLTRTRVTLGVRAPGHVKILREELVANCNANAAHASLASIPK